MDDERAQKRRNVLRRRVVAGVVLTATLAVPAQAAAVLAGHNGRIVFTSGRDGDDNQAKLYLRTIDRPTGTGRPDQIVTTGSGQHRNPTWSPDRTKIAYALGTPGSAATEDFDIFIHDLTTGVVDQVTADDSLSSDRPAWSPDGSRIAWEQQPSGGSADRHIVVYTVASGDTADVTPAGGTREGDPAWSPNSQTLYYSAGNPASPSSFGIFSRSPASSASTPQTWRDEAMIGESEPSVSPDGTRMCFTRSADSDASSDIMIASLSGVGTPAALTVEDKDSSDCTWSPDGTKVAYVHGSGSAAALVMENFNNNPSDPFVVLEDQPGFDGGPDWAPDGKPVCSSSTVNVPFNTPVTIPLSCVDTGPAYEHSQVIESIDLSPSDGTLTQFTQGDPASVVYTPQPGFAGQDSFTFRARDFRQPADPATVTLNVAGPPSGNPPAGGNPPTGNQPPPGGGSQDLTAAQISALRVSPTRWRRGSRLPRISARRVGTTIRFELDEPARVTLAFAKAVRGRSGTRYRSKGSIRLDGKVGMNRVRFQGRLTRARRLGLGRHRVTVAAVDAAGNRSAARRASFTIVR